MSSAPAPTRQPAWSPPGRPRRRARRRRGRALGGCFTAVAAFAGILVLGGAGVLALAHHLHHPAPPPTGCWATANGTAWALDSGQADSAATIAAVTARRGLPAHATTIALATAMQESKLRNIEYGDRDSLGLFQQRPSQGWGTETQVLDPVHSTNAFLDALVKVPGWQTIDVTVAAQKVQRSAYPDAYAIHEESARAWAAGLSGQTPTAVSCTWGATVDGSHTTADLSKRLTRDYGSSVPRTTDAATGSVTVDATTVGKGGLSDRAAAWSVASWAVALSEDQDIVRIDVDGQSWVRGAVGWHAGTDQGAAAADPGAGHVRITVAH